jgi:hypothetical protein
MNPIEFSSEPNASETTERSHDGHDHDEHVECSAVLLRRPLGSVAMHAGNDNRVTSALEALVVCPCEMCIAKAAITGVVFGAANWLRRFLRRPKPAQVTTELQNND